MEDLVKNIKATLYDRITNPLLGTFALSWLVSNWKLVYVTLFVSYESIKPINKLDYLLSLYPFQICPDFDWWSLWTLAKLLILPVFVTWLFIWILPKLIEMAYEKTEESKSKRRIFKTNKLAKEPVTPEKVNKIIEEYEERLKRYIRINEEKQELVEKTETSKKSLSDELALQQNHQAVSKAEALARENTISGLKEKLAQTEKNENLKQITINNLTSKITTLEDKINKINPSLEDLFTGKWRCDWIKSNGSTGEEAFEIIDGYKYIKGKEYTFNIDQYYCNKSRATVKFRKIFAQNNQPDEIRVNELSIRNARIIEGNERVINSLGNEIDNVDITYTKMQD